MDHEATYSPQDDKIRLYFAYRIPRPEWDALRALGFSWTMKQKEAGGCDMVAPWTPEREDRALELAGEIGDEDQPREERAAQRAERFEGYQKKRFNEATGHADVFDATPAVHGHQNLQRAERAAAKHDRIADKAVSQWDKAEYWTNRTAGVISHALYVERADVRHRRIKGIEADLRKMMSDLEPSETIEGAEAVLRYRGQEYVDKGHDCVGIFGQGRAKYARSFSKAKGAFEFGSTGKRWHDHYQLRLAYEKQMLAAQGGTAANVEVLPGGFYGKFQVQKLSKDRAGRVSKVWFKDPTSGHLHAFDAENLKAEDYRPANAEELAAFEAEKKAGKAGAPKHAPLINPTKEAAQALCDLWNKATAERRAKDICEANYGTSKVIEMTQAEWTRWAKCGDSYRACAFTAEGRRSSRWDDVKQIEAFRLRVRWCISSEHLVVITDKPQTAIPLQAATPTPTSAPAPEKIDRSAARRAFKKGVADVAQI